MRPTFSGMQPEPRDVRVIYRDGTEQAVEVAYFGENPDGIHVWQVTSNIRSGQVAQLRIGMLPAGSAVRIGNPGRGTA